MITVHARPRQTDRQTDRRTNIVAIARRFLLTNASRAAAKKNVNFCVILMKRVLQCVFQAYQNWVTANDPQEIQLPNKNITSDQFFFIAFAQVMILLLLTSQLYFMCFSNSLPVGTVPCSVTLQDLSCGPRLTQNFWWATRVRFLQYFISWLRILHFGLVWLWHTIRRFRIPANFLQIFVSTRGPLQGLRPTRNCGCCGALNTALSRRRQKWSDG